ncbi:MAG: mechanosensitive ion channel protein MscS [Paenibacillaceae bacterium]|jgi:small conductance mechanosensitive channel|nr:mechanosensitive ion channel protein MscS [Paenibacillaceae bacterium]
MSAIDSVDIEPALNAYEKMTDYLSDPQVWSNWLVTIIQVVIAIIIGRVLIKISQKALTHMMVERERSPIKIDHRRTKTIGKLLNNIVTYTVNFILILIVLGQFGINLGPVLAGAGVLGLAIGFGAQSLVKDVITGFFIIFEDQFAVGDVIQTGSFKGTVEEVGLRVTRLRSPSGEVHVIPNGTIQQITNFSIYNSIAIVDITIPNTENAALAIEALKRVIAESYAEMEQVITIPEVLGIQSYGTAESVIRITAECKPNMQAVVERDLKGMFKEALEQMRRQESETSEAGFE